jgi:hypothetical protein
MALSGCELSIASARQLSKVLRNNARAAVDRRADARNAATAAGVGFLSGIGKLYEPWAEASKVMISRVQAFKRHARQEAASAITHSPEASDASGSKIRRQAA